MSTVRWEQNGLHYADDIFKHIFVNENSCDVIWISFKFVPHGSIDNYLEIVEEMDWHQIGNKLLSKPMLTDICKAIWHHYTTMKA